MYVSGGCPNDSRNAKGSGDMGSPCRTEQQTTSGKAVSDRHGNDHSSMAVPPLTPRAHKNMELSPVNVPTLTPLVISTPRTSVPFDGWISPSENFHIRGKGSGDDSMEGLITSNLNFHQINEGTPKSLRSLLHAPILHQADTSVDELIKRPSGQRVSRRFSSLVARRTKRPSPARREGDSPDLKKRKETVPCQRSHSLELPTPAKSTLKRCQSEADAVIKAALDRVHDDPTLISDGSKPYSLPTIPGKHQDLNSITPETVAQVVNNEFCDVIEQFLIIDCRYPYEYEGGHIQGAVNYYTKEAIVEKLLMKPMEPRNKQKRVILIFHCEFSSERAPKLSRFLRSMDRDRNKECYPELYYPELYLLHGGYKSFFENQKELCTPQSYVPMLHEDYKADLRKFRAKSKSWPGEKKSRFTLF